MITVFLKIIKTNKQSQVISLAVDGDFGKVFDKGAVATIETPNDAYNKVLLESFQTFNRPGNKLHLTRIEDGKTVLDQLYDYNDVKHFWNLVHGGLE